MARDGRISVYVAGSTKNVAYVSQLMRKLEAAGLRITFDWTGAEGEIRSGWQDEPERARQLSTREKQAVKEADVLVLCCPPRGEGCGCFIEFGMACAYADDDLGPIFVLGAAGKDAPGDVFRDSVFFYLEDVTRLEYEYQLWDELKAWFPSLPDDFRWDRFEDDLKTMADGYGATIPD